MQDNAKGKNIFIIKWNAVVVSTHSILHLLFPHLFLTHSISKHCKTVGCLLQSVCVRDCCAREYRNYSWPGLAWQYQIYEYCIVSFELKIWVDCIGALWSIKINIRFDIIAAIRSDWMMCTRLGLRNNHNNSGIRELNWININMIIKFRSFILPLY